jgi:hypothetical protein
MKHFLIKMLLVIAPTIFATKMTKAQNNPKGPFSITADYLQFSANPLPENGYMTCMAKVNLVADIKGQSPCNESKLLYYHIEIDINNDGNIDMIASSDVNHDYYKWTMDAEDQITKLYLAPDTKGDYTLKIPEFFIEPSNASILWTISDQCGNTSQFQSNLAVIDRKAPTPYCVSISTAILQSNPALNVFNAIDFDKGAFDNCTAANELKFTFDGVPPIKSLVNEVHFYKAGANGSVLATHDEYMLNKAYKWNPSIRSASRLWLHSGNSNINIDVWDDNWNTDFCTVVLHSICFCNLPVSLSGMVKNVKGEGLVGALVLIESNPHQNEFSNIALTNENGGYYLNFRYFDFILSASYTNDNEENIGGEDLTILSHHLSGKKPFTKYWQYIAADINEDKTVDKMDLWELKKLLLNKTSSKWKVIVEDQNLGNGNWSNYNEKIEPTTTYPNIDFIAIQLGDLDGEKSKSIFENYEVNINSDVEFGNKRTYHTNNIISISPNPFNTNSLFVYSLEQSQEVKLKVFDRNGIERFTSTVYGTAGINTFDINETMCPNKGIYFISIEGDFGAIRTKIVKI